MIIQAFTERRLVCAVTLTLAAFAAETASAQFTAQPQYGQPYAPPGAYAYQQTAPAQQVPAATQPAFTAPQQQQPAYTQLPAYQPQAAYAPQAPVRVAANGNLPSPVETVQPARVENVPATTYAAPTNHPAYAPAGDCGQPSYQPTAAGCSTCDTGSNAYSQGYSAAPACDLGCTTAGSGRQWFGGVYGLYMTRDNPGKETVAVLVEDTTSITTPYYPAAGANFLATSEADVEAQWGYELRFGSTFGCDPTGCGQPFAWEVGYWSLDQDESQSTRLITTTLGPGTTERIYGMKSYVGLEYDRDGAGATYGYRPLNEYMDYQMPVTNPAPDDIRVVGVRVRQRFEVENLELNFWRFGNPMATPSLGVQTASCGTSACGTSSCGTTNCRPPRRFFINGVMGVRYVTMDEDWQNAIQFAAVDGTGTSNAGEPPAYTGFPIDDDNVLFHDIETENRLLGFQLGCSMNWLVGCNWNFFADSNFGVYGNDMDVHQCIYSGGGGTVRFVGDATDATVRASKNDVAFLGELRVGVGYQVNCNWRLTTAYRMIGMSGVALGVEQVPSTFSNAELLSHIDGNDSMMLHGLQTGLECKY